MLMKCPECELQVSDKANSCPHCGYPISNFSKEYKSRSKRMRLPNGFGQITYIKGNLRNHYRAMVTVGKNEVGKPICKMLKPISYFPSYNDAYAALVEYNKNPYDLDSDLTVKELYEQWTDKYFKTLNSKSSERTITSAWAYCKAVYSMRAKDLRARHIKSCMDAVESPNIKGRIKSVFNIMLDYALEYELVDKNYARTFSAENLEEEKEKLKKDHIAFTEEELQTLWEHSDEQDVRLVLIQTYSGLRPQELCVIERSGLDIEQNIMTGGMKTSAGRDRDIPIHDLIKDFVVGYCGEYNFDNLFWWTDKKGIRPLTYDMYRRRFEAVVKRLNLNPEHRPHDPRKTFVTLAKKYNVDEYALKRIVGHEIQDITEKTYTERQIDWLNSEMKKIKKM